MNKVILVGYTTKDTVNHQGKVYFNTVAINKSYKNKSGEWVDDVTFVDVAMFGKTGEYAEKHIKKGALVSVEGSLNVKTEGSGDSYKKTTSIVVNSIKRLLEGKGSSQPQLPKTQPKEEDVPF